MKKGNLLKRVATAMAAAFIAMGSVNASVPQAKITAMAAGGSSYEDAVSIQPNYSDSSWVTITGDQYYKVTLPQDGLLNVRVTAKDCELVKAMILEPGSASTSIVYATAYVGSGSTATGTNKEVLSAGTYYIKMEERPVRNATPAYKLTLTYTSYGVSESTPDSYDNPKSLPLNTTITDTFTYTDREDWYKLAITKEAKYVIKATSDTNVEINVLDENLDYVKTLSIPTKGTSSKDAYLKPGVYYVKCKGNDKYAFSINNAVITPSKVKKVKTLSKKKAEVTFTTSDDVRGYEIQYSTDKNFKKNVKSVTFESYKATNTKKGVAKYTIKKLKKNKKYYVRIRSYVEDSSVNYYSDWSKAKAKKIK